MPPQRQRVVRSACPSVDEGRDSVAVLTARRTVVVYTR
jgi:hypothetical protein